MTRQSGLRELVRLNSERFKHDCRYSLHAVSDGFAHRSEPDQDDTPLFERICAAYIKATERQQSVSEVFAPTKWWREIGERHLGPVIQALRTRDIRSLRRMYRNFFRDPCSTGLVGLPVNMERCYFTAGIRPVFAHFFLGDALHRLDVWRNRTHGLIPMQALASPSVGNPYGIVVDGVFIRIAAEYQHFYAHEIRHLLPAIQSGSVLEIGGGFGGMAYYLFRDKPHVNYLNFDVPETLALAAYYLLKSFPKLSATLYGEAELTPGLLKTSQLVLMPTFELPATPDLCADVAFTSHVITDLSPEALHQYAHHLARTTRTHILLVDHAHAHLPLPDRFTLTRERKVYWDSARALTANQVERLYRID